MLASDRTDEEATDSVEATRSGRHIRRRRFDDEIVQSSLTGSAATAMGSSAQRLSLDTPGASIAPIAAIVKEDHQPTSALVNSAASTNSPHCSPTTGRTASSGTLPYSIATDASMDVSDDEPDDWRPSDDLLLINAIIQLRDIELVQKGTRFSYPFSLEQITNRWRQLLYSEPQSAASEAIEAMNDLHPSTVEYLERKMPFSAAEEAILATVPATTQGPSQQRFQAILDSHREVFQPCRTAKQLFKHWQLLRQYFLLADQHVPAATLERGIPLNFSDVEEEITDQAQSDSQALLRRRRDLDVDYEQRQLQRAARREMKRLEAELPLWQALTDSAVTSGSHGQDFDNQTLAVLRGRLVRYLMRSKEISLGRSSRDVTVDIDFSLEGPAFKVSRRQAIIKLRTNGEFVFANEGKRPVYIDGNPVLTGNKCRLNHNSVVELAGLRFVFLVNMKLINSGQADLIQ